MSRSFSVISHTDTVVKFEKFEVLVFQKGRGFISFLRREGFISPARRTAWFTGSALSDDSQFFATPPVSTRTCRKFAPPILSD